MTLGELIKSRRDQAGLSLQELADAAGATKGHVWDIENDRTANIGLLLAVRLSIALGVPVNSFAAAALETMETKQVKT